MDKEIPEEKINSTITSNDAKTWDNNAKFYVNWKIHRKGKSI